MKRTYSPRIHLQPADDPKPLSQIWQGQTTLEYLNLLGGLTAGQVYHLLLHNRPNRDGVMLSEATARRNVNRQLLRPLKELGLVAVKPIAQPDNPPAKWEMNVLTQDGYQTLQNLRHPQAVLPFRHPKQTVTRHTIDYHAIGIRDAAVSAISSGWRNHLQVMSYLDDQLIRSLSKQRVIDWPMEPDFVLVFRYGAECRVFMGEVDRGTESGRSESKNSWESKMRLYNQFFSSQRKVDAVLAPYPQPDVMVVTDKPRRLPNLMKITAERGGRSAYWFTTTEYLQPPYAFFEQVWQRIGLPGYYSPTYRFLSQQAS